MAAGDGLIVKLGEQEGRTGIEGHPNLTAYRLLQTGEEGSLYLSIGFDDIEPGGGIDAHYHADAAPFDHAYYVISGDILAKVGDKEERVGANTLIYCRSGVVHSIKNMGSEPARLLRIGAAANSDTLGRFVYMK